jgi:hypothetical protein
VIGHLQAFAERVRDNLETADWALQRQLIYTLVKRVEVGTEEVRVVYRVDCVPFEPAPSGGPWQDCWRRRSGALPSAQVRGMVGAPKGRSNGTEQRGEEPSFGPVVRSELPCGNLRSLPWGQRESVLGCGAFRPRWGKPASTSLGVEWPGRRGIRTRYVRIGLGPLPGRAAHGDRERYLAKECVGSNRAWQRTIATSRSDENRDEARNGTAASARHGPRPTNPKRT